MLSKIEQFSGAVGRRWCRVMHPDPMWPVNGMYQCPRCQRKFPVPWESHTKARGATPSTLISQAAVLEPAVNEIRSGALQVS